MSAQKGGMKDAAYGLDSLGHTLTLSAHGFLKALLVGCFFGSFVFWASFFILSSSAERNILWASTSKTVETWMAPAGSRRQNTATEFLQKLSASEKLSSRRTTVKIKIAFSLLLAAGVALVIARAVLIFGKVVGEELQRSRRLAGAQPLLSGPEEYNEIMLLLRQGKRETPSDFMEWIRKNLI